MEVPTGRMKLKSVAATHFFPASQACATTYCLLPCSQGACGRASRPGCCALTVTGHDALAGEALVAVSWCDPVATLEGTSAFTCVGLMKKMKADFPPIVTLVSSSEVGA